MAHYLDTSAIVKLVVAEAETDALRAWIAVAGGPMVSSDLARTEVMRAVRRAAPGLAAEARTVLDSVHLLKVESRTFEAAGRIDPTSLRSLDAIHLAAALTLEDDLQGIVTYDERLAEAAGLNGVHVLAPA